MTVFDQRCKSSINSLIVAACFQSARPRLVPHLEDFHLQTAVRRGPIRHLQTLNKCFSKLLHDREDQGLGCTLHRQEGLKIKTWQQNNIWTVYFYWIIFVFFLWIRLFFFNLISNIHKNIHTSDKKNLIILTTSPSQAPLWHRWGWHRWWRSPRLWPVCEYCKPAAPASDTQYSAESGTPWGFEWQWGHRPVSKKHQTKRRAAAIPQPWWRFCTFPVRWREPPKASECPSPPE